MPTLARVELLARSGLPEDIVVNDFAIDHDAGVPSTPIIDAIAGFYTEPNGAGNTIAGFLGSTRRKDAGGFVIKLYDITGHLDGSPHGSPYRVDSLALGGVVSPDGLPEEVAVCITTRGEDWDTVAVEAGDGGDPGVAPDRPRQRHSGKLYIGPLRPSSLIIDATTGASRVPTAGGGTFGQLLLDKAIALQIELLTADMAWCVWSRKDAVLRPIVRVEVDNAPDTQRRRGSGPSVRVGANVA